MKKAHKDTLVIWVNRNRKRYDPKTMESEPLHQVLAVVVSNSAPPMPSRILIALLTVQPRRVATTKGRRPTSVAPPNK